MGYYGIPFIYNLTVGTAYDDSLSISGRLYIIAFYLRISTS